MVPKRIKVLGTILTLKKEFVEFAVYIDAEGNKSRAWLDDKGNIVQVD